MKKMQSHFLSLLVIIGVSFFQKSYAQFLSDNVTGRPITSKAYTDIKGSPYLYDDWSMGIVKLDNGVTYKDNIYLKYNLLDDELYFKDSKGETMTFVQPVKEFTIGSKHYRNGYGSIKGASASTFLEVLVDGTAQLLKKTNVVISENKEFNSATVIKTFEKSDRYYVSKGAAGAEAVKKDMKSILSALKDKQTQLQDYIKQNDLNLKKDEDLARLITYYNSI